MGQCLKGFGSRSCPGAKEVTFVHCLRKNCHKKIPLEVIKDGVKSSVFSDQAQGGKIDVGR
jgi:hypothetical protein